MELNSRLAVPRIKTSVDVFQAELSVQDELPMEEISKAPLEHATRREAEFVDTIPIPMFGSSAQLEALLALPEIPSHHAALPLKHATDSLDSVKPQLPQHAMAKPTTLLLTHAPSTIKESKSFALLDHLLVEMLVSAHLNTAANLDN